MVILESTLTFDVDDVERILFINAMVVVPVVVIRTLKSENILGSNGIPKCKR
ncbi:MAG: hypothetical protein YK1309IOTA_310025 [Marine Group I thaumarchaeote]|nr:MAG: hypothetical protein YK1309IOTA_310025 [Marine Group I thaumarchaeote]